MNVIKSLTVRPFTFPGRDECVVRCDLQIHTLSDGRNVCICTERPDTNSSITHGAAEGATWAAFEFRMEAETIVWIEHVVAFSDSGSDDDWNRIVFTVTRNAELRVGGNWPALAWRFSRPTWRPMIEEDWRDLGLRPGR